MFFDAYNLTIHLSPTRRQELADRAGKKCGLVFEATDVMNTLFETFGKLTNKPIKRPGSWLMCAALEDEQERHICDFKYHSSESGEYICIESKGESANHIANWARMNYPSPLHICTRVDVAEDIEGYIDGEPCFNVVVGAARQFASDYKMGRKKGIQTNQLGDWAFDDRYNKGRTFYVGSRKSAAYLRIYEKGKQLIGQGMLEADITRTRIELECKMQNEDAKIKAAAMEPGEFWGISNWSKEFWELIDGREISRIIASPIKRKSSLAKKALYLHQQYSETIAKLIDQMGLEEFNEWIRKENAA